MQLTATRLSTDAALQMWKSDPRCAEETTLKAEAQADRSEGHFEGEKYRRYTAWNPIPQNTGRNFEEIEKNVHPAIIREDKLFRINNMARDIFSTSFVWDPKIEEEITGVSLVGRYITLHTNGYPLFFKPSIGEVLVQLPEELVASKPSLFHYRYHQ